MGLNVSTEMSGSFWWGIWLRKLGRAKIAPPPDWWEDQVQIQQMLYDSRAAITSTGQWDHPPNSTAVPHGQRKGTVYNCTRCGVDLCMVPCFAEYHTRVNFLITPHCKYCVLWSNSDPKCHRPSAATRIMWAMDYLHHILCNTCNSQA